MRRTASFLAFSILTALFALSTLCAQPRDDRLLKSVQAQQKVITDKLTAELKSAVAEATRLQATSKIRAINVLKTAMSKLEDPLVPPNFKAEWTATLSTSISRIEKGEIPAPPAPPAINPVKREMKEAERARVRSYLDERDTLMKSFGRIQSMAKGGRPDLAQDEMNELIKKYPDNPAVMAMAESSSMSQKIADAKVLIGQQQDGFLLAMRSVDRSAVPPKGDIEFDPVRWKEINKLRPKGPKFTAKEQAILKALDTPVDADFKDAPFEEVLKSISKSMGQEILLDKSALQGAMIESNTATTLQSPRGRLSARTALRVILQEHGLTYIIRDQRLEVVTMETAKSTMVTRVYYLGDLIQGVGPFSNFGGAAINFGPQVDLIQTMDNVNRIVEMIKGGLDPESWKERGGNGTIVFHLPSMSLIVRQTAEVHSLMSKSFGGGQ